MKRLFLIQHVEREGPVLFSLVANQFGFELCTVKIYDEPLFPDLVDVDALLILGGPMGVSDISNLKSKWMYEEIVFIRKAIQRQIPLIGVCLGAQLIAYATGGHVKPLSTPDSKPPLRSWMVKN